MTEETGRWFALADDGNLYCLADCGDIEAAEESAEDLGIKAVWLINPETASAWRDLLNREI